MKRTMNCWRVTIYRVDSHTPIVLDDVKHAWWEDDRYVVAQYSDVTTGKHHYWTYPGRLISHLKEERANP